MSKFLAYVAFNTVIDGQTDINTKKIKHLADCHCCQCWRSSWNVSSLTRSSLDMTSARRMWHGKDEYDVKKMKLTRKRNMTCKERELEEPRKVRGSVTSSPTLERDKQTSNSNTHKEWIGKLDCPGGKPISLTQLIPNTIPAQYTQRSVIKPSVDLATKLWGTAEALHRMAGFAATLRLRIWWHGRRTQKKKKYTCVCVIIYKLLCFLIHNRSAFFFADFSWCHDLRNCWTSKTIAKVCQHRGFVFGRTTWVLGAGERHSTDAAHHWH